MIVTAASPSAHGQQGSSGANPELLAWSEALKHWRSEGESAALQLSRGILFDCAAHRPRGEILFTPSRQPLAGNESCRIQKHPQCAEEAERAFARAVNLDPNLVEARLRLGAARSERDPEEGLTDLAEVYSADGAPAEMRYLAAVFSGKAAWARHDQARASEWFTKAAALNQAWSAARLLLQSAAAAPAPIFGTSESLDPWYGYRCGTFTPSVRDTLAERIRKERDK